MAFKYWIIFSSLTQMVAFMVILDLKLSLAPSLWPQNLTYISTNVHFKNAHLCTSFLFFLQMCIDCYLQKKKKKIPLHIVRRIKKKVSGFIWHLKKKKKRCNTQQSCIAFGWSCMLLLSPGGGRWEIVAHSLMFIQFR